MLTKKDEVYLLTCMSCHHLPTSENHERKCVAKLT